MKKAFVILFLAVIATAGAQTASAQQATARYTSATNAEIFSQPRWSGPEGLALKTASELNLVGRFMLNEYLTGPRLVTVAEGAKFWVDAVSLQTLYVDGCVDADGKPHPNRVRLLEQPTTPATPAPAAPLTAQVGPPGAPGPPGRDGRDGRDATATATATATAEAAQYPADGNFERYPTRYPRGGYGGGYDPYQPPYYDSAGWRVAEFGVRLGEAWLYGRAGRVTITNVNTARNRNVVLLPQATNPVKNDGGGPTPFARRGGFGGGGMARMGGRVGRR